LGLVGAWFFLILAPTSSFVPIKDPLFEHRMYLPLAAILAGLVIGLRKALLCSAARLSLSNRQRKTIAWTSSVAIVAALGCATLQRNSMYHDPVVMWRDITARRPHNARAFEQLGTALVAQGRLPEAIEPYRRAVTIEPDFVSAHANLGNALTQTGQFEEAISHYDRVRRLDPDHVEARLNRGHALDMLGRGAESIEAYREATQVNRRRADRQALARAYYNLGSALGRQGDLDAAVNQYRKALELEPDYEKAHYSLGWVLEHQGHLDEAVKHYSAILDVNPDHEAAQRALEAARNRLPEGPD
jgi:tetratricopeptide (TPR) repeat protein